MDWCVAEKAELLYFELLYLHNLATIAEVFVVFLELYKTFEVVGAVVLFRLWLHLVDPVSSQSFAFFDRTFPLVLVSSSSTIEAAAPQYRQSLGLLFFCLHHLPDLRPHHHRLRHLPYPWTLLFLLGSVYFQSGLREGFPFHLQLVLHHEQASCHLYLHRDNESWWHWYGELRPQSCRSLYPRRDLDHFHFSWTPETKLRLVWYLWSIQLLRWLAHQNPYLVYWLKT